MAWQAVTEDNVETVLSGSEIVAYKAAALAAGQTDPVAASIAQAVDLVRGYVGAGGHTLGAAATIPQKLLAPCLDIIAWRVPSRVGRLAGESRRALYDDAIALLELVAKGGFDIEEPLTETTETSGGALPSITAKTLNFTTTLEDGI